MKDEKPNITGKRKNKLEEIVGLLQKLNEDFSTEEKLEKEGYHITVEFKCDGSGNIYQQDYPESLYAFNDLIELETFLKADRKEQYLMGKYQRENS